MSKDKPLVKIFGKGKPLIGLVGCVHGNESVGLELTKIMNEVDLKKGRVKVVIANRKAIREKKRYINSDLNRSFPGKIEGNHEERLAAKLIEILNDCDAVIDIHSASEITPGFGIVTNTSKQHMDLAKMTGLQKVVIMSQEMASGKALIDHCKVGVSLEFGPHDAINLKDQVRMAVESVFVSQGMIDKELEGVNQEVYVVEKILTKSNGFKCSDGLQNFKLVKKGAVLGADDSGEMLAKEDFYPILLREKAYPEVICLVGKKKA